MSFEDKLKQKLSDLGATPEQLNIALRGNSKQDKMQSFNVYLAAKAPKLQTVETLRSFSVKGDDDEILKCVDDAAKVLSKHVFNHGKS